MSLDALIAGMQLHGIGCEQTNYGYKLGFVMPEDVNVAVKYKEHFNTYENKYTEMKKILDDLRSAGATINKTSISVHVEIFGGIPAFGTWACYEVQLNRTSSSPSSFPPSLARKLDKLIPAVFY